MGRNKGCSLRVIEIVFRGFLPVEHYKCSPKFLGIKVLSGLKEGKVIGRPKLIFVANIFRFMAKIQLLLRSFKIGISKVKLIKLKKRLKGDSLAEKLGHSMRFILRKLNRENYLFKIKIFSLQDGDFGILLTDTS